ncbi:MAG: InlB B-repeat-containing protein [Clostridia bacterium]|nr:InlB B-repeat-containing protein [Clostridia bacterium]
MANFVENGYYLITFVATEGGHIIDKANDGYSDDGLVYALSTKDAANQNITVQPDEGYRLKGWYDEDGNLLTTDEVLKIYNTSTVTSDIVVTAFFEKITEATIYYQVDEQRGEISATSETVTLGMNATGSTATAKTGYRFVGWVDQNGVLLSTDSTFVPAEDQIVEGATYIALFEPSAYHRYMHITPENPAYGYIISPDYDNTINGRVSTMYIGSAGTAPATIEAVAYEEYVFDHWTLNEQTVTRITDGEEVPLGSTIPAGFDLSSYISYREWSELIAHYRVNTNVQEHTIHYHIHVSDNDLEAGKIDNDQDVWLGSDTSNVQGSRASVKKTGYTFGGWIEYTDDTMTTFNVIANSKTPELIPSGDSLKDADYYAVFYREKGTTGGYTGYNMNLTAAQATVVWNGPRDWYISSGAGAPMYYSNRQYTKNEEITLSAVYIPEAEGYYFVGWFDKDRPGTRDATVYSRSDLLENKKIKYPYSNNSRFTLEAIWCGIDVNSLIVPYDGQPHTITAQKFLNVGTLAGNNTRYRKEIEQFISDGTFQITGTSYQLYNEDGTLGEAVESSTFTRTQPGTYNVRVTAICSVNGYPVTLERDAYIIIYPAQVIINKIWMDWYNETGIRPSSTKSEDNTFQMALNQGYLDVEGGMSKDITAIQATARNDETEPEWVEVAADKWTETYSDVLVRPNGYGDTNQNEGWYDYDADEIIPSHYFNVSKTRVVSNDGLTTEITFVNRIIKWPIHFVKKDMNENALDGAELTITMLKNADGNPPAKALTWDVTVGEADLELYEGTYRLEETTTPEGYRGLLPIYFKVDGGTVTVIGGIGTASGGGVELTDENGGKATNSLVQLVNSEQSTDFSIYNLPQDITLPISGTKQMLGRDLAESDVFTFTLEPARQTENQYPGLPQGNILSGQNDQTGAFTLNLKYTYEDFLTHAGDNGTAVFWYKLTEEAPEGIGTDRIDPNTWIRYSDQAYWIQVVLSLDDNGKLAVVQSVYEEEPALALAGKLA